MSKQHDEDDEEFGSNEDYLGGFGDESEESYMEDPLQKEKLKEHHAEKVKKILISQGFEEDELKVMFPDTDKMVEFYEEQRRGTHSADSSDIQKAVEDDSGDSGPEPEDDYELDDVAKQKYLPVKPLKAVSQAEAEQASDTKVKPKKKKDDNKKV